MYHIFLPAKTPEGWIPFLTKPDHWKKEHSARALALCWHDKKGWYKQSEFPKSIYTCFINSRIDFFNNLKLLYAFPEFVISIKGGGHPPQNDLYVLARNLNINASTKDSDLDNRLICIMVEGKVDESFDDKVADWLNDTKENLDGKGKSNKHKRLNSLLSILNITGKNVDNIHYQLIHRAASAVIEAQRIGAKNALILVHSFSQNNNNFKAFESFVDLFNLKAIEDSIVGPYAAGTKSEIDLYFGWANGDAKYIY